MEILTLKNIIIIFTLFYINVFYWMDLLGAMCFLTVIQSTEKLSI